MLVNKISEKLKISTKMIRNYLKKDESTGSVDMIMIRGGLSNLMRYVICHVVQAYQRNRRLYAFKIDTKIRVVSKKKITDNQIREVIEIGRAHV